MTRPRAKEIFACNPPIGPFHNRVLLCMSKPKRILSFVYPVLLLLEKSDASYDKKNLHLSYIKLKLVVLFSFDSKNIYLLNVSE